MGDKIEQRRVIGSGGRPRTVWVCESWGHWHGSYGQAVKCEQRTAAARNKAATK